MIANEMTGPLDESQLARISSIMGEFSASFRALNDAKERRENGEVVAIFMCCKTGSLLVGPCPPSMISDLSKRLDEMDT